MARQSPRIPLTKAAVNLLRHREVSWDAAGAQDSRTILQNAGIDINEAANGVFLPSNATKASLYSELGPNHKAIHTAQYYINLKNRLASVPQSQLRGELQKIGSEIIDKTFIW